jgi:hypothetical protein
MQSFVCVSVAPLLLQMQNHMFKGNKGNQPESKLEAQVKRAALDV